MGIGHEALQFIFIPSRYRTQTVEVARADAERIRLIGGSEATAIEAVGKADAERMRLKAAAYRKYGDAAKLSLVLETLPKVCRDVRRWGTLPRVYNISKLFK